MTIIGKVVVTVVLVLVLTGVAFVALLLFLLRDLDFDGKPPPWYTADLGEDARVANWEGSLIVRVDRVEYVDHIDGYPTPPAGAFYLVLDVGLSNVFAGTPVAQTALTRFTVEVSADDRIAAVGTPAAETSVVGPLHGGLIFVVPADADTLKVRYTVPYGSDETGVLWSIPGPGTGTRVVAAPTPTAPPTPTPVSLTVVGIATPAAAGQLTIVLRQVTWSTTVAGLPPAPAGTVYLVLDLELRVASGWRLNHRDEWLTAVDRAGNAVPLASPLPDALPVEDVLAGTTTGTVTFLVDPAGGTVTVTYMVENGRRGAVRWDLVVPAEVGSPASAATPHSAPTKALPPPIAGRGHPAAALG